MFAKNNKNGKVSPLKTKETIKNLSKVLLKSKKPSKSDIKIIVKPNKLKQIKAIKNNSIPQLNTVFETIPNKVWVNTKDSLNSESTTNNKSKSKVTTKLKPIIRELPTVEKFSLIEGIID